MNSKNITTDPSIRSFIPVPEYSPFPIQNLPYCVFRPNALSKPRIGVAIGEWILDLSVLEAQGFFTEVFDKPSYIFSKPNLNPFMSMGNRVWHEIRSLIFSLLREDEPSLRDRDELRSQAFTKIRQAYLHLPADIRGYTDFYSSKDHAARVGKMFRDEKNALFPNWLHIPVAFHGRASSIVLSGTDIRRPCGQVADQTEPVFCPTRALDFELEMGFFIGPPNSLGQPIPIEKAAEHIFGLVLVNDWSARDIQKWEYQPLGPFLAKNFATSISPWVVTTEALQPFRLPAPDQKPLPLPYLRSDTHTSYNIHLEVALRPTGMPDFQTIIRTNFRHLYWTMHQQLAHHTSNGCNLQTGDLLASGTISGPDIASAGCLLEVTQAGRTPLKLSDESYRTYLEDGDTVSIRGWCEGQGYTIGFGEVSGKIVPALE